MKDEKVKSPFGETCETCPMWVKSARAKYYQTPEGGFIPVASVAVGNLPPGTQLLGRGQTEMAPCANMPMWFPAPSDHWCWQHPKAIEKNTNGRYRPVAF